MGSRNARRAALALLVAAPLVLAACGTDGDPTISADEGSAVTVAGADSAIAEEGDDRPEEETDAAAVVSVVVDLPEGANVAGNAIVALEDITYADAEATEIASVELTVDKLLEQNNTVEVFLPLPLDGSIDVTATVHIDVDESGSFSQGDWISPELAMVAPGAGSSVTVTMVQI